MAISGHRSLYTPHFLQHTPEGGSYSSKSCKMPAYCTCRCVSSGVRIGQVSSACRVNDFANRAVLPNKILPKSTVEGEDNQLLVEGLSRDQLIKDHVCKGSFADSVRIYLDMIEDGVALIDVRTFCVLLKAVGELFDIEFNKQIHGHLLKLGALDDIYVANSFLGMSWKSGAADDAVRVFKGMQEKDSVSWNIMISGSNHSMQHYDALEWLRKMVRDFRMYPKPIACLSALSSCGSVGSLIHGQELHAFVVKSGFTLEDYVVCALLDMYMKCGNVHSAELTFNCGPNILCKNTVLWNVMISGYVDNGCYGKASSYFVRMMVSGTGPDSSTMVAMLVLCSLSSDAALGEQIHALTLKLGLEMDIRVKTTLIDMYFNCRNGKSGLRLFKLSQSRNLVMWGAVISNSTRCGCHREALKLYSDFRLNHGLVDSVILLAALRACASLRQKHEGMDIHGLALKLGLDTDAFVGCALVDMYMECHDVDSAEKIFRRLPLKDVVSWNALLCGYLQNHHVNEALRTFFDMQSFYIKPNAVTIATLLSICSYMSTISLCKEIHCYIIRRGFDSNILVSNSLLAAYAKCGNLKCSLSVFQKMNSRDRVSWNGILQGLGIHGQVDELLDSFEMMKISGMKPDHTTFTCILSACSHAGRLDEGFRYFKSMVEEYKLEPHLEQYTCMVDLLGRAGHLNQAFEMIKAMPCPPDDRIWGSLLGSCRIYGEEKLSELVSDYIFKLQPASTGYRVLLANLYQDFGRRDEVARIRSDIKEMGLQKSPGCSWIEVDNQIYSFTASSQSHHQSLEIYDLLG